jgi:hypothetical protein
MTDPAEFIADRNCRSSNNPYPRICAPSTFNPCLATSSNSTSHPQISYKFAIIINIVQRWILVQKSRLLRSSRSQELLSQRLTVCDPWIQLQPESALMESISEICRGVCCRPRALRPAGRQRETRRNSKQMCQRGSLSHREPWHAASASAF